MSAMSGVEGGVSTTVGCGPAGFPLSWGWQVVVEECDGPVGRVMSRFPDRLHGGSAGARAAAESDCCELLGWQSGGGTEYALERVCW